MSSFSMNFIHNEKIFLKKDNNPSNQNKESSLFVKPKTPINSFSIINNNKTKKTENKQIFNPSFKKASVNIKPIVYKKYSDMSKIIQQKQQPAVRLRPCSSCGGAR